MKRAAYLFGFVSLMLCSTGLVVADEPSSGSQTTSASEQNHVQQPEQSQSDQNQTGQSQPEPNRSEASPTHAQDQQPQPPEPSSASSSPTPQEPAASSAAATPAPATTGQQAPVEGLISVDFKDADIRQVLRVIALKSGIDIVAGPDVEGLVTIKLTSVPWEQALDLILKTYGLAYEQKGKVVRVMTLQKIEQEALSNEVFPLNYAKAKEVMDVIKDMLSDRGKVKSDERTNTVIVTDLSSSLFQLKQIIDRLDQPTPQVHIAAKIVETKLTNTDDLGIQWMSSSTFTVTPVTLPTTFPYLGGASLGSFGQEFIPRAGTLNPSTGAPSVLTGKIPDVGGTFTYGTLGETALNITLNALKQRIHTNVISHPTIVTLNNKEASVQVGEDINIPNFQIDSSTGRATVTGVNTRSTGVIMKVTPHVNPQREIVLDLNPEVTSVGATFDDFGNNIKFPRFTVQKATTQVRLKDGETLVIGGLVKRQIVVTTDKVPFPSDIPVVGAIFTHRREADDPHQDLLMFLTVRLIEGAADEMKAMAAEPARPDPTVSMKGKP